MRDRAWGAERRLTSNRLGKRGSKEGFEPPWCVGRPRRQCDDVSAVTLTGWMRGVH